jgi:hypothetical protein
MGLGMFQKHRRERHAAIVADLTAAVEAAETDEDREAAQAALDAVQPRVEAAEAYLAGAESGERVGTTTSGDLAGGESGQGGPEKPNAGASTEVWRTWALDPAGGGKSEEDLKDLGRDAIRDLFA